jgi:cyanophycinase-like exopeptidase
VCELRIDMRLELDAIDIILSLMDQLYDSRARFDRLIEALGNQPENVRNSIIKSLRDA